jgi:hypothetical protein
MGEKGDGDGMGDGCEGWRMVGREVGDCGWVGVGVVECDYS